MRRMLALVAVLVIGGGCVLGELFVDYGEPADPRPTDLFGTWSNADGGSLVFTADGRFTATKLPYWEFHDFLPDGCTGQVDGGGVWELRPARSGGPDSVVGLDFGPLAGQADARLGESLDAVVQDGKTYLVFFMGAGGNSWHAYEKTPAPLGGGGGD
ncbi:hypothetical protein QEZ54_05600 [Catellatospora sp. KI3]|uniref:hypothetical protein n=1 Tax=Catellatospora sp. KI3 TaxID=3041620 RepID=UPI0024831E68|nr:hypothetical protein [Catellatospora sp. KI3]MDI1460436.1 hypothetical protein [Catellatospora sp. KI3]